MNKFFFTKKTRTVPNWKGWFFIILLSLLSFRLLMMGVYPFLSKNDPVVAKILVVDALLPDYVLKEAVRVFDEDNYEYIVATGGEFATGHIISGYESMAHGTKETLVRLGMDSTKVIAIKSPTFTKSRTYEAAKLFADWYNEEYEGTSVSVNVFTVGCHARRSWLLYKLAAKEKYSVGVIAVEDITYDIDHWWTSSRGMRAILSEGIAYTFVKLFFTAY